MRTCPSIAAAGLAASLAAACSADGPDVRVVASAGGAGYWPANSRTAVAGAIELELEAIELDVVLSRDLVPFLSSRTSLDPSRCTYTDGTVLDEPLLFRRVPSARLREAYVCGGVPEPSFDQALVVAEPPMGFGPLLDDLHDAPGATRIFFDIHQRSPATVRPDRFAAAVLDRWIAEDLPQDLVITSPLPEVLEAFDTYGRSVGFDVETWRVFPDPDDDISDAAAVEAERWAAGLDYVTLAEAARADGLLIRHDLADPRLLRAARAEGLALGLWTVDDPRAVERIVARREVDVVLTNYPGDAP